MTVTHECGHVVGGWLGGGTLREAELRPWHLPHSLFVPDPFPLLTLWSGPVLGVIAPISVAMMIRQRWMWFIADFSLLANGVYLAMAWISDDRFLDTPRLLEAGAWRVSVLAYCIVTIGFGYIRFRQDCFRLSGSIPNANTCCNPNSTRNNLFGVAGCSLPVWQQSLIAWTS